MTPKHKQQNEKIDELDLIKINNFCASKDIIKMKRQPTKWEKIFSDHISDKGLVSRMYKGLLHINSNDSEAKCVCTLVPATLEVKVGGSRPVWAT